MCADKVKKFYNEYRRPRYFHGMLLDDKDFLAEQRYHAAKRRLLNRMLHPAGVVCGLELTGQKEGKSISVSSGLALDCCGNEIWVDKPVELPLADLLPLHKPTEKTGCPGEETSDPTKHYLAIRYIEQETDPVSVYLPGAGCDERKCENSRVKEGYAFEVVTYCPKRPEPQAHCGVPGPCPECHCDKSCPVVLGRIDVGDPNNPALKTIFVYECREYVLSSRLFYQMIHSTYGKDVPPAPPKDGDNDARNFSTSAEGEVNPVLLLCKLLNDAKNSSAGGTGGGAVTKPEGVGGAEEGGGPGGQVVEPPPSA